MTDVSERNFGYLIAFIVPGFVVIVALRRVLPGFAAWPLDAVPTDEPSVGGFLYITLASVTAGIAASTVRWLVVDSLHHATGIRRPAWNDSQLQGNLAAFQALVDAHYRFYQHYANGLVAFSVMFIATAAPEWCRIDWSRAGLLAVIVLYWFASRDCLRRYYRRTEAVLGSTALNSVQEHQHDKRSQPRTSQALSLNHEPADEPRRRRTAGRRRGRAASKGDRLAARRGPPIRRSGRQGAVKRRGESDRQRQQE